jgi:hypothetical protein
MTVTDLDASPHIYAQVSRWLRERDADGWILAGGAHRRLLVEQWRDVVLRYGDESPPACGVLLALVREAYAEPSIYACTMRTGPDTFEWIVTWWGAPGCIARGPTEGLALAAALMAAPQQQEKER